MTIRLTKVPLDFATDCDWCGMEYDAGEWMVLASHRDGAELAIGCCKGHARQAATA